MCLTSQTSEILKAALSYANRGWPVCPMHTPTKSGCSCGKKECDSVGKHPRWDEVDLPNGIKNATTDTDIIKPWWQRWPDANIAIATGEKSFDCLDVDIKPDVDGRETLENLEHKHIKLPDTVEGLPGGGGRHIMFEHNDRVGNTVKFAPGLDTRTDGGYIVAPPSLHVSGRRYEWELSSYPGEIPLAPWPEWLLRLIEEASPKNGKGNPRGWEMPLLQGVAEGQRGTTAARLAGLYINRGLAELEIFLLLRGWNLNNKPPLSEEVLRNTIKSIERTNANSKTPKPPKKRIRLSIN